LTRCTAAVTLLCLAVSSAVAAAAPIIEVRLFGDNGRHEALVRGAATGIPALEPAVAHLLTCQIERMPGGWLRCRERNLVEGLAISGSLDFTELLALPGMAGATATVTLPASPLSSVTGLARQPASGWLSRPVSFSGPATATANWRMGFFWQTVAADLTPLPFLLFWLIRRPEPRLALAAALSVWVAWLVSSRTIELDDFFYVVPGVEGTFLHWISLLPLWLLIIAQSRWLRMAWSARVWIPVAALVLLRPRSAPWMTFSEIALADVITIALLVDRSGSMRMPASSAAANDAAHHLVSWMSPEMDRIGVFAFDVSSTQTSPFGTVTADSLKSLDKMPPYGATSLYDALDFTGAALVGDGSPRRAVVAITDGRDTASTLTAAEVASRTSIIDVPVYIMSITPDPNQDKADQIISGPRSPLDPLTAWTGGQLFFADVPSQASLAARTIVNELRQQYLLAFTPDPRPGWHKLTVRTRQHHTSVRARAGYVTR